MNEYQKIVYDLTIQKFKETITDYTDEQLQFAEGMTEKLLLDSDTSKVNVVPANCGLGKSILIRCYIKAHLHYIRENMNGNYEGEGFVVVTDLLKRFNEFEDEEELEKFYYLMKNERDENFQEQIQEQNNYPILLMTTQKYFKLKEDERDFIFKWRYGERKTIFFDEKPSFFNVNEIDKDLINAIDSEIGKMFEDEDKNFLNTELIYLRDYLESEWYRLTSQSKGDVICYWKGNRKNLTTDDDRFLKLVKELSQDNQDKVEALKDVLVDGAIFVNKKTKGASDNRRLFFTVKDNKSAFYLNQDRAKFWVFDATADVDVEYHRNYIDMLNIEHKQDYNVNIKNINIGTSRNVMRNNKATKNILNNYIRDNYNANTLLVSYMEYVKNVDTDNKEYFNNLKGLNVYRHKIKYAQIGLNRFSDIAYLQILLSLNSEIIDCVKQNPNTSDEIFEILLDMEYGNFTHDKMNQIMYSKLLVDIEQNMFRTKLREYSNQDIIKVDLFYNAKTYEQLNILLEKRLNTKITVAVPDIFLEHQIISRDNKELSVAQKIVKWFKNNEGYGEIRTKELLELCEVTNNQFSGAKRDNNSFNNYIKSKQIKRGWYVA